METLFQEGGLFRGRGLFEFLMLLGGRFLEEIRNMSGVTNLRPRDQLWSQLLPNPVIVLMENVHVTINLYAVLERYCCFPYILQFL